VTSYIFLVFLKARSLASLTHLVVSAEGRQVHELGGQGGQVQVGADLVVVHGEVPGRLANGKIAVADDFHCHHFKEDEAEREHVGREAVSRAAAERRRCEVN